MDCSIPSNPCFGSNLREYLTLSDLINGEFSDNEKRKLQQWLTLSNDSAVVNTDDIKQLTELAQILQRVLDNTTTQPQVDCSAVQAQLVIAQKQLQEAQAMIRVLQGRIKDLEKNPDMSNCADCLREKAILEAEVQTLRSRVTSLQNQIAAHEETISSLREQIFNQGDNNALQRQLIDLQNQLSSLRMELNDANNSIHSKNDELIHLRNQLNSEKSKVQESQNRYSSLESEYNRVREELRQCNGKITPAPNPQPENPKPQPPTPEPNPSIPGVKYTWGKWRFNGGTYSVDPNLYSSIEQAKSVGRSKAANVNTIIPIYEVTTNNGNNTTKLVAADIPKVLTQPFRTVNQFMDMCAVLEIYNGQVINTQGLIGGKLGDVLSIINHYSEHYRTHSAEYLKTVNPEDVTLYGLVYDNSTEEWVVFDVYKNGKNLYNFKYEAFEYDFSFNNLESTTIIKDSEEALIQSLSGDTLNTNVPHVIKRFSDANTDYRLLIRKYELPFTKMVEPSNKFSYITSNQSYGAINNNNLVVYSKEEAHRNAARVSYEQNTKILVIQSARQHWYIVDEYTNGHGTVHPEWDYVEGSNSSDNSNSNSNSNREHMPRPYNTISHVTVNTNNIVDLISGQSKVVTYTLEYSGRTNRRKDPIHIESKEGISITIDQVNNTITFSTSSNIENKTVTFDVTVNDRVVGTFTVNVTSNTSTNTNDNHYLVRIVSLSSVDNQTIWKNVTLERANELVALHKTNNRIVEVYDTNQVVEPLENGNILYKLISQNYTYTLPHKVNDNNYTIIEEGKSYYINNNTEQEFYSYTSMHEVHQKAIELSNEHPNKKILVLGGNIQSSDFKPYEIINTVTNGVLEQSCPSVYEFMGKSGSWFNSLEEIKAEAQRIFNTEEPKASNSVLVIREDSACKNPEAHGILCIENPRYTSPSGDDNGTHFFYFANSPTPKAIDWSYTTLHSYSECKKLALSYMETYKLPEIRIYGMHDNYTQYLVEIIKAPKPEIIPPAPVVPSIPNPRYYWLFNEDLGKRAKLVNTDINTYPGYTRRRFNTYEDVYATVDTIFQANKDIKVLYLYRGKSFDGDLTHRATFVNPYYVDPTPPSPAPEPEPPVDYVITNNYTEGTLGVTNMKYSSLDAAITAAQKYLEDNKLPEIWIYDTKGNPIAKVTYVIPTPPVSEEEREISYAYGATPLVLLKSDIENQDLAEREALLYMQANNIERMNIYAKTNKDNVVFKKELINPDYKEPVPPKPVEPQPQPPVVPENPHTDEPGNNTPSQPAEPSKPVQPVIPVVKPEKPAELDDINDECEDRGRRRTSTHLGRIIGDNPCHFGRNHIMSVNRRRPGSEPVN